jgi:hypothetical protein
MNHLVETAKHYANLAEQYRSQLVEEQQLNEDLLVVIDALCEELNLDTEQVLQQLDERTLKALGAAALAAGLCFGVGCGNQSSPTPTSPSAVETTGSSNVEHHGAIYGAKGEKARQQAEEIMSQGARGAAGGEGVSASKTSAPKRTHTPAKKRSGNGVPSGSGGGGIDES